MMKPACVLVLCVGACAFMPSMHVEKKMRSKYTILNYKSRDNKCSNNDYDGIPSSENMDEECDVQDMYTNITETRKEQLIDDFKFNITFFDCFMALMFGGKWSAAFFWKEVEKQAIKDSIKLVLIVGVVYGIYTGMTFTVTNV